MTLPPPHLPSYVLIDSDKPDEPERSFDGKELDVGARSAVLVMAVYKDEASSRGNGS